MHTHGRGFHSFSVLGPISFPGFRSSRFHKACLVVAAVPYQALNVRFWPQASQVKSSPKTALLNLVIGLALLAFHFWRRTFCDCSARFSCAAFVPLAGAKGSGLNLLSFVGHCFWCTCKRAMPDKLLAQPERHRIGITSGITFRLL